MPNDITWYGQQVALFTDDRGVITGITGTAADEGGIAHIATDLGLFNNLATRDRDPTVETIVANPPLGGGYVVPADIIAITAATWTASVVGSNAQIVLTNQVFTSTPGTMNDVLGAYISDADDNVMAYWERSSAITLATNDTITADQLTIRIV